MEILIFLFSLLTTSQMPSVLYAGCDTDLWVIVPTRGLYQSIPVDKRIRDENDLLLETSVSVSHELNHDTRITTSILDTNDNAVGSVVRQFSADRTVMVLLEPVFPAPSFINLRNVVPLIKGRGVPSLSLITLMQMRMAGVRYGGLRRAFTGQVDNYTTALELRSFPDIDSWFRAHPGFMPPGKLLADHILDTTMGIYLKTVFAQSGHRIKRVVVIPGTLVPFQSLTVLPSRIAQHSRPLLDRLGPDDLFPFDFEIFFDLVPL